MADLKNMRKWINRDDGNLLVVGNCNINTVEIIAHLILITGVLILGFKVFAEFKPYGWGLLLFGIVLLICGGKRPTKSEDK